MLDTWFSSGLWPFCDARLARRDADALTKFYPASDLETGYDILFFWVARMMMIGLHFMKDVPFRRVLLHGMVVDETGDKMSKVKGNVIDPLDLIHGATFDEVMQKTLPGAPARRGARQVQEGVSVGAAQMGDRLSGVRRRRAALHARQLLAAGQAHRARAQAHRGLPPLLQQDLERDALRAPLHREARRPRRSMPPRGHFARQPVDLVAPRGSARREPTRGLTEFRFDDASSALYRFFWDELCDWYLEITKPDSSRRGVAAGPRGGRYPAARARDVVPRAPSVRPVLTEELWQAMPRPASRPVSIALARFPTPQRRAPRRDRRSRDGASCRR